MAGRHPRGWSKVHQEVFKLRMNGMKANEIAEKVGLKTQQIYDMMNTKKFMEHESAVVENAVDKARKLLEGKLVIAADKIVQIMTSGKPEDRLRFDAAKEILYQCGMKPVEVIEDRRKQYTPEEIHSSLLVVKEMQAIEEKLSTQGSGFLVQQDKQDVDASSSPSLITNNVFDLKTAGSPADTKVEEVPVGS